MTVADLIRELQAPPLSCGQPAYILDLKISPGQFRPAGRHHAAPLKVKKMNIRKMTAACLALACIAVAPLAQAEPTSPPVHITYVRPYGVGNIVFVQTDTTPGNFCSTSIYTIDLSTNNGKAMFAIAHSAMQGGKPVMIELLTGSVCLNGNPLNSIYALP